jgi:hypothetical protein
MNLRAIEHNIKHKYDTAITLAGWRVLKSHEIMQKGDRYSRPSREDKRWCPITARENYPVKKIKELFENDTIVIRRINNESKNIGIEIL